MPNKPREQLELRKQALLDELEDIQRLLQDGADDIPILNEPLEKEVLSDYLSSEISEIQQQPLSSSEPPSIDKSVLPGQQALFNEGEANTQPKEEQVEPETNTENAANLDHNSPVPAELQDLIDRLISHNLPKVEEQLRKKLLQAVEQHLKNK